MKSNYFSVLRMLFLKKGEITVGRYWLFKWALLKSWNQLVVAGWKHTLVPSLSAVLLVFFFLSILQNGCTAVESLSVQNIFFPELFLSLSSKNPQCMLSSWYSAVFIGVRKMTKEQHNQENTLMLSLILPVCMILLKRVLQFHLNPHFPFLLPPLAWWLCHCWEG